MRRILLLAIALCQVSYLSAQTGKAELDQIYTPPEGSVLFSNEDDEETPSVEFKNSVRFNMLQLVRGKASFEYERSLHENFSVGCGVASSFMQDPVMQLSSIGEYSYGEDPYLIYDYGEFTSGFQINPFVKLKTDSWFFDNSRYTRIGYRYNTFNYDMNYEYPEVLFDYKLVTSEVTVIIGIESQSEVGKLVLLNNFYYGAGFRAFKFKPLQYNNDYNIDGVTLSSPNDVVSYGMTLYIGYSLGIGW